MFCICFCCCYFIALLAPRPNPTVNIEKIPFLMNACQVKTISIPNKVQKNLHLHHPVFNEIFCLLHFVYLFTTFYFSFNRYFFFYLVRTISHELMMNMLAADTTPKMYNKLTHIHFSTHNCCYSQTVAFVFSLISAFNRKQPYSRPQ